MPIRYPRPGWVEQDATEILDSVLTAAAECLDEVPRGAVTAVGLSTQRAHERADLTEVVRLYGIRHWIEQSYKQVKDELGWADFQVRSATAIRRHQTLVNCAFSFCWDTWFDPPSTTDSLATAPEPPSDNSGERGPTRNTAG